MTIDSEDQIDLFDHEPIPALHDDVETVSTTQRSEELESFSAADNGLALPPSPPTTLTEALAFARKHERLSVRALAETASALKVLQTVIGRPAENIPAAPQELTPLIESASPGRYRVEPKRWMNVVSLTRTLLRACDLHAPLVSGRWPSLDEWATLLLAMPIKKERLRLLNFSCWCSDAGIRPNEVDEKTLEGYSEFRRTQTIRTHLVALVSSIRIFWNRNVRAQLPGWPSRLLTAPRNSRVEALPLTDFPLSFQSELNEYLTQRTKPDAFDANQRIWRPATVGEVRRVLIRAASLMAGQLGGPEHVQSLAQIVTVEAFEFVLRHLYDRAGGVWSGYAGNFATYLVMLARDFVHVDEATLSRHEERREIVVRRRREHRKPGLSERVAESIRPFDDPKLLRRLFRLPGDLYALASKQLEQRPVRAAQLHERGLMLDLLQSDPMRRYNLASINFEDDLKRDERGRIVRHWASGDRTKNGIAIDTPISPDLAKRIQVHLAVYRPLLRGSNSSWLFPSPQGNHRTPDNVTNTLSKIMTRLLGVHITPHMFRHIIATWLYRTNPNNGVVVQRILRHTSVKNTERMYGQMSNAGSSAVWQKDLQQFRRAAARTKRPSRTSLG